MNQKVKITFILLLLSIFYYGCNEDPLLVSEKNLGNFTNKLTGVDLNTDPLYFLWAEQDLNVGNLIISKEDAENLSVTYKTSGSCLTETHLHIADDPNKIPQKEWNATPTKFDFMMENSDSITEQSYIVPFEDINGDGFVYIAAHGVVEEVSSESDFSFPSMVEFDYYGDENYGFPSSFNIIVNNPSRATTVYDGWCMGYKVDFYYGNYSATAFNSYINAKLNNELSHYQNLDLINWIINQHFAGKEATCGGEFNLQDVQVAIWELLEQFSDGWTEEYWAVECRVSEIINLAKMEGKGYIPISGDYMCVILEPENGFQPVLIEVKIPYNFVGAKTFWAGDGNKGVGFPGNDSSKYIKYKIN